ncbi:MAG: coproporphyrinogen dehydrogenase HemZ [Lachnospiraceae bacterium]|nr:coproporphyrinogen dehydrogenase HemZ [Lachnospiraceae bacterium]
MISYDISDPGFEYDAYSLLKAFYGNEEIKKTVISHEANRGCVAFVAKLPDGEEISAGASIGDKSDTKNELKRLIYEKLSGHLGRSLPWGTLTGIRPTKIAYRLLEDGWERDRIIDYMKETYLCSEVKSRLATDIALKERRLLQGMESRDGYSLYIGIPFCPSICLYCSFASALAGEYEGMMDGYLDALIYEMKEVSSLMEGRRLISIYIGGGTPTSLNEMRLDRLLSAVSGYFDTKNILEYTVEAGRPDSITAEKLKIMKDHGVDRISINPQTMNDDTLLFIGRSHSVSDIYSAYEMARDMDFKTINMDIITGLPNEGMKEVRQTAAKIADMKPDNLTVHSLAVKRSSRLNIEWEKYKNMLYENSDGIMKTVDEAALAMGMEPYYMYRQKNIAGNLENIGYSLPGHEGLYNILIMEERVDIVALGAGADSKHIPRQVSGGLDHKAKVERCENVKNPALYIERIDEMIERKRSLYEGRA